MDANSLKEEFSYAYVHGVTTAAGYICHRPGRQADNDGIDVEIRRPGKGKGNKRGLMDVQVKCSSITSKKVAIKRNEIKFALEVDSYSELIKEGTIPYILVLVLVPEDVGDWIDQSEDSLIIKKCGYYKHLQGGRETQNKDNITISIPTKQVFTPEALKQLMRLV